MRQDTSHKCIILQCRLAKMGPQNNLLAELLWSKIWAEKPVLFLVFLVAVQTLNEMPMSASVTLKPSLLEKLEILETATGWSNLLLRGTCRIKRGACYSLGCATLKTKPCLISWQLGKLLWDQTPCFIPPPKGPRGRLQSWAARPSRKPQRQCNKDKIPTLFKDRSEFNMNKLSWPVSPCCHRGLLQKQ